MPIDIKVPLSKEYILSKVTQEQIFEKYLGIYPDVTRTYRNPLRDDQSPGCRFYYDDRGVLKFKDFSASWNWDCFNVVEHNNGGARLSFMEVLKKISDDFNLIKIHSGTIIQEPITKRPVKIELLSVEWNKQNLAYWNQYHIYQQTLNRFNVKPITSFWLNDIRYNVGKQENAYAYCFSRGKIKIYLPDRDFNRFYQNFSYHLQGWEQLPEEGERLLITKSYKDVISQYQFGICSIAPPSEGILVYPEDYENLKQRFREIYILMDNDMPGKRATIKYLRQYEDLIPLLFPQDMKKDWTDNLKEYGEQYMLDVIESITSNDF
jgi:hypothetical protein